MQIKELARLVNVASDTIINWELRNVKPSRHNLEKLGKFSNGNLTDSSSSYTIRDKG